MKSSPSCRLLATLLAAFVAVGPSPLLAQDAAGDAELVTPTDAQQEYNNRGVVLIQDGKYKQAIASFRSSLSLGELNITYLNLGRAYFRLERCLEAREAYDMVRRAPKVESPTPAEIREILKRFEAEYSETCSATIAISCEGDPQVMVDDAAARPCSAVPAWPVVPGEHEVTASYDTGEVTETVESQAGETTAVAFEPEAVVEAGEKPAQPGPSSPPEESEGRYLYSWIVFGTAMTFVAGAFVYDLAVTAPQVDELEERESSFDGSDANGLEEPRAELESDQNVTLGLGAVGAALLVTSGIMFLIASGDDGEEQGLSAYAGEDGIGVVWRGRFQ